MECVKFTIIIHCAIIMLLAAKFVQSTYCIDGPQWCIDDGACGSSGGRCKRVQGRCICLAKTQCVISRQLDFYG